MAINWQLILHSTLLLEQYPLIKKSPKEIAFCLEALFSLNIHLEVSKSSLCFYLMLQQTCCMHSLASKLGCYVSIHMHKYQEFIQVNLRISKVPSYWRWSPLIKSCSFSDEPPYSRTPLIRDSRVDAGMFGPDFFSLKFDDDLFQNLKIDIMKNEK